MTCLLTPSLRAGSVWDTFLAIRTRDEGRDLIQSFDVRKSQTAGLQFVELADFVFELPDHALVAATNRCSTLASHLQINFGEGLAKVFYLSRCSFSLRVVLDHDACNLIT